MLTLFFGYVPYHSCLEIDTLSIFYFELSKSLLFVYCCFFRTALKYITAKQDVTSRVDNSPKTLLESWLTSSDVDSKDVLAMVCDMLLAGIDTVSYFK